MKICRKVESVVTLNFFKLELQITGLPSSHALDLKEKLESSPKLSPEPSLCYSWINLHFSPWTWKTDVQYDNPKVLQEPHILNKDSMIFLRQGHEIRHFRKFARSRPNLMGCFNILLISAKQIIRRFCLLEQSIPWEFWLTYLQWHYF